MITRFYHSLIEINILLSMSGRTMNQKSKETDIEGNGGAIGTQYIK